MGWVFSFFRASLGLITFTILSVPVCGYPEVQKSEAPIFGRYAGFLQHDRLKMDQLATLDFIVGRESNSKLQLMAILKLQMGDFDSKEYVSYHFDNVSFDLLTGVLVFEQSDAEATFVVQKFTGQSLAADFRSQFGGTVGKLALSSVNLPKTDRPLIEPLGGEYQGACPGLNNPKALTVLQLHTYRSSLEAARVGNPFGTYSVKGVLAQDGIVATNFASASYDFFNQNLVLYGRKRQWVCQIDEKGMLCNGNCRLSRTSELSKPRKLTPHKFPLTDPIPTDNTTGVKPPELRALSGQYYGYLYHEYLNRYQEAGMNILSYPSKAEEGKKTLTLSADANLFFAGRNNPMETITYHFDPRTGPSLTGPSILIFRQPSRDTDAVLQVSSLANGIVKGVWYSLRFGRVGTFELKKEDLGMPDLPKGATVVQSISGRYESTHFDLALRTILGRTTIVTENPFAPLEVSGILRLKGVGPFGSGEAGSDVLVHPSTNPTDGVAVGGTYDFYTGRLGVEIGSMAMVGTVFPGKWMHLHNIGHSPVQAQLGRYVPAAYRYLGEWKDINNLRYGQ